MNKNYLDELPDDTGATATDEEGLEPEVDLTDEDEKEAEELNDESTEELAEEELDEDDDEDDEDE